VETLMDFHRVICRETAVQSMFHQVFSPSLATW
jgi:hypothetical protein